MSAQRVETANPRVMLSKPQKNSLSKMLAKARSRHPAGEVTDRLERLAAEFREKLKKLGFRPAIEDWDRSLSSHTYSNALTKRVEGLSTVEYQKRWAGVGKADRLLREFCVKLAQSWTSATGRPLPVLDRTVVNKSGTGYQPNLQAFVIQNPMWLVLDAAGLKLSANTVKDLTTYARRKVREHAGGPIARRRAPNPNPSKPVRSKRKKSAPIQRSN